MADGGLEPQGCFTAIRLQQEIQRLLRTVDQNIGVQDCIERAAFAIVDGYCQPSCIAHCSQDEPIDGAVAERGYELRLLAEDKLLLFPIVALLTRQKVQLYRQSRQLAADGAKGVDSQDVDFNQFGEARKARPDALPHHAVERVCAGVVGHKPPYFEWPTARYLQFNH